MWNEWPLRVGARDNSDVLQDIVGDADLPQSLGAIVLGIRSVLDPVCDDLIGLVDRICTEVADEQRIRLPRILGRDLWTRLADNLPREPPLGVEHGHPADVAT